MNTAYRSVSMKKQRVVVTYSHDSMLLVAYVLAMTDYLVDARACSERRCRYGAVCQLTNGVAECVCPSTCQDMDDDVTDHHGDGSLVCGSDSQTYGSACQLMLFACRLQKDITIAHYGPCQGILLAHLFTYLHTALLWHFESAVAVST